jgi:AraC-like DNA-binding protein
VDRFWAVTWDLPDGVRHRQQVLTHPSANVSVGTADAREAGTDAVVDRVFGVARDLVDRELAGTGWTVAAMTTPGGLGAFLDGPASALTDRTATPAALGWSPDLAPAVTAAADEPARVAVLAGALEAARRPARVGPAREVAAIARVAETDRAVRRVEDLAGRAGVGARTLQRMFGEYAGVSPTWVVRRYRLLDAAEAVRAGDPVVWAELAAELGYADQAHLVRDFRGALGRTPHAYARSRPSDLGAP